MAWTDHSDTSRFDPEAAGAEEILLWVLALSEPREAEERVVWLDRHREGIEQLLAGRGRWAVLKSESPRGWAIGPLGFVGPMGAVAFAFALGAAWLLELSFPGFVLAALLGFVVMRLAIVKPDHRDWLAAGTPLGAGVVAAWAVRNLGEGARPAWDARIVSALATSPEYWHDLAGRAVSMLPEARRERVVLDAFRARPDDLWHMLPFAPTDSVVRAALARGPRSSATADFHAFQSLIRQADVAPVLEAIRAGASNRDVLIRAVAASGNPAAADLLVATLAERNGRLRSVARDGLVTMGPAVLPRLYEAFELDNPRIQRGVARVIRAMRPNDELEEFATGALERRDVDPVAASELRKVVVRSVTGHLEFGFHDMRELDDALARVPAPAREVPDLQWRDGVPVSPEASLTLADLLATEAPDSRSWELARIRGLLDPDARNRLMEIEADHPVYRMVLADEAELLRFHVTRNQTRKDAEEWVDVLERHGSLAAIHALDDLWRTGIDGVVQTSAMAALMRISGQYDGLEFFADELLIEVLRDANHPLYPSFSSGQFRRFEQMMIGARRVSQKKFWETFQTLPAQQVLWGAYDGDGDLRATFRLDEDFAAVDEDDEPFVFDQHVSVGIVHPAELGPRSSATWGQVFVDYELVPHFEQLQRVACRLDVEAADRHLYTAFGDIAPAGVLEAALIQRGWRPSPMDIETVFSLTKPVQRGRAAYTAIIELDPGFGADLEIPQRIESLSFTEGHHHVMSPVVTKVRLGDVESVIFSEVVLELKDVLHAASTGEDISLPAIPTRLP